FSTQNSKLNNSVPRLQSSKSSPCPMRSAPCESPKATFFVLGWIAERYPDLVRRIQKEGHEIACHGYGHRLVYAQSRDEFTQDIRRAKSILEDITGAKVMGYRAPSYSITNKSQWAFEILAEEGFKYDSSIFPIHHDFYGMPEAPRFPFAISLNGNNNVEFSMLNCESNVFNNSKLNTQNSHFIIEFPLSTVKVLGTNFPISGGGYFRLFPYLLIKRGLRSINEKEGRPFIFYMHPWEIDSDQPRVKGLSSRSSFRHYVNLDKTESRFRRLLKDFQFSTVKNVLHLHNLSSPLT
ncbi:MAG TPA: XrtA system polysaccharide deacetylase, partial [Candidatus Krumholzibacteriaceae bacterium]|nr:XrtA system polysaccharide deacetylase [Candidatus Krumholzibacteriaceae bacterium]